VNRNKCMLDLLYIVSVWFTSCI